MPMFCKYKYIHVKIASLAIVKSCVTVGVVFKYLASLWISSQP